MPLDAATIPNHIVTGFQDALAKGLAWDHSSLKVFKDALVSFLIAAQGSRCAYCQRIIKDEIGHRELDHILPKGSAGKPRRAISNHKGHRRSTLGYPQFRFELRNLILTCKRCNHRKGNYDCRSDRSSAVPVAYPSTPNQFEWIHPFYHEYSDHIKINSGFVYQEVPGSNGLVVIDECSLASIHALEARAREAWIKQMKDPNMMVWKLLIDDVSDDDIVDSVLHQFPNVVEGQVRSLLKNIKLNLIK